MEENDVKIIEIILFIENRPLPLEVISKMAHIAEDEVLVALSKIKEEYNRDFHGITLEDSEEGFSFVPKKYMYEDLKKTYGKKVDSRLTQAAKETLSIIAYNQGSTRHEIDDIRGVSSDNMLKFLKEKGYIKVIGRRNTLGNPCEYGTTEKFLYEFNLSSIKDLPTLDDEESAKYEEKDETGQVFRGRVIKKRMKEEFKKAPKEEIVNLETTEKDEKNL